MTEVEQADQHDQVGAESEYAYSYCSLEAEPERTFSSDVSPDRSRLIRLNAQKWVNGTVLHYHFFDRDTTSSRSTASATPRGRTG